MAGNHNSGRRRLAEGLVLPKLGRTENSVRRFAEAVIAARLEGGISKDDAEIALAAANLALRAIKEKANRHAIDEVRDMLKRAEEIEKAGIAREVADRQHAEDDDEDVAVSEPQ